MASKESLTRPYQLVIEGKHSNKENTNQIQIILLTSSTHPNGHKNVSTENPVNIIPNDIFPPQKKQNDSFLTGLNRVHPASAARLGWSSTTVPRRPGWWTLGTHGYIHGQAAFIAYVRPMK